MLRVPLIVSVLVLAGIPMGAARAADVPVKAPVLAPANPAAPYSWTGLYAGIHGGYSRGISSWTDPSLGVSSGNFNVTGGLVGAQLGYNWQTGPLVLGVETDASWMNSIGRLNGACGGGDCEVKQSWVGTTRGRIGYAFGYWMPYITAGAAYGNITALQPAGSASTTNLGWSAGAGVEVGFLQNWSAKLEFLHLDLGTASFFSAASGTNPSVPLRDDQVRAGISYHW